MHYKLVTLFFLVTGSLLAQSTIPALIPAPQTVEVRTGSFVVTPQTRLVILTSLVEVRRNWPDFVRRMEDQFHRFDVQGINYAPSVYNPIVTFKRHPMALTGITLSHGLPNVDLYYSTDNTLPDDHFPLYTQPFIMPKGANRIKVIAYRNGKPVGQLIDITMADIEKRIN